MELFIYNLSQVYTAGEPIFSPGLQTPLVPGCKLEHPK